MTTHVIDLAARRQRTTLFVETQQARRSIRLAADAIAAGNTQRAMFLLSLADIAIERGLDAHAEAARHAR